MDLYGGDIGALSKLLEGGAPKDEYAPPPGSTAALTPADLARRVASSTAGAVPAAPLTGAAAGFGAGVAARVAASAAAAPPTEPAAKGGGSGGGGGTSSDKDIWSTEEVAAAAASTWDPRERPKYDILYKQAVGAEDVYLGMSGKTPSSVDCEAMVVKVTLPGCMLKDIDLHVTRDQFSVQTARHKLAIFLPRAVRHKDGKAQWNPDTATLSVSLPVIKVDPL